MPYEIKSGPFHADPLPERRGRKSPYPLRQMKRGEWIAVPIEEEMRLWRAAAYARQRYGVRLKVGQSADGKSWIVARV